MKKIVLKFDWKFIIQSAFLFCFFILGFVIAANAQEAQEMTGPGAPVDGGLSLLLAAGAGYGIKKIREKRLAKSKMEEL